MADEFRLVILIDSKNAERNTKDLAEEISKVPRMGDFGSKSTEKFSK